MADQGSAAPQPAPESAPQDTSPAPGPSPTKASPAPAPGSDAPLFPEPTMDAVTAGRGPLDVRTLDQRPRPERRDS
jgi:hypothetical protein